MLSIGEIARLCRISTKAMRHYDRINLIKPRTVNEENGYRFYDMAQVRDVLFINRMQSYGFSLAEISFMLASARPSDIQAMLRQKIAEQQNQIVQAEYAVRMMEEDIGQMERGNDIMQNHYTVKIIQRDACHIASIRKEMGIKDFDKSFEELFHVIETSGYTVNGPAMAVYHSEDFDASHTDIETAISVQESTGANIRTLPGGQHAMTTFVGPYVDFSPAYSAIEVWLKENNREVIAPPFEVYVKGVGSGVSPEQYVTEIYFPIR